MSFLLNSRIALSVATIAAAGALVVGATFAYFSDTSTSSGNIFTAGTLDLLLDDNNESTPSASVAASIGGSNMAPGDSVSGFISLHNGGTVNIAEVELGATQTNTTNNGDGSNLSDVLNLTVLTGSNNTCTTGQVNQTGTIATVVGDGFSPLTLTELVNADYDALPGLGSDYFLCMTATMDTGAVNAYQGDSVEINFDFVANQNASQ